MRKEGGEETSCSDLFIHNTFFYLLFAKMYIGMTTLPTYLAVSLSTLFTRIGFKGL